MEIFLRELNMTNRILIDWIKIGSFIEFCIIRLFFVEKQLEIFLREICKYDSIEF